MKPVFAFLALISAATLANGQDLSPVDVCRIYGDRAAAIAQARQDGLPYLDALDRYGNAEFSAFLEYVYRRPIMPTASLAAVEVQEMRAAVEMVCMQGPGMK